MNKKVLIVIAGVAIFAVAGVHMLHGINKDVVKQLPTISETGSVVADNVQRATFAIEITDENTVEYKGTTYLIYNAEGYEITDKYLDTVHRALVALGESFKEEVPKGVVLCNPSGDSFSILAYSQRTEYYIDENLNITDWRGKETIDAIQDLTDMMTTLDKVMKDK